MAAQSPAFPAVVVAVTTYRRAQLLDALLPEVISQASAIGARVCVVDNDPDQSARATAERHSVGYALEPTPGIASARQRALDEAATDELVVMIDDDVYPETEWLAALIECWAETHAAAVMGFVDYVWPPGTDPWVVACGAMRRTPRPTGSVLPTLATGNVLFDNAQIRARRVAFRADLGLQGGEDTLFGSELSAAGGVIVACRESVVRDEIPAERATRNFARRRMVSHGASLSARALRDRRGVRRAAWRMWLVTGALTRLIAFGAAALLGRMRRDLSSHAVGMRRFWVARGRLSGALGMPSMEYSRG